MKIRKRDSRTIVRGSRQSRKRKQPEHTYQALEPRQLLAAIPIINEFVASNNNSLLDGNGSSSDWIELYNAGDQSIDLANWSLTDDANNLGKWKFPVSAQSQLAPGAFRIVFASGNNVPDLAGKLHTNFQLAGSGEHIALVNSVGTVVSSFGPNGTNYPTQYTDISYGRPVVAGVPDLNSSKYFSTPTPGAANSTGFDGVTSDTNFSVKRGYFTTTFSVNISSQTLGSTIVYTTNGSEPSLTNGTQVTAGVNATPVATVSINTTTALRAKAFKNGFIPTNIDTQTYLFLANVVQQPNNPAGFPSSWGGAVADYEMDPEIVNDPLYTQDLLAGLRELPALTISSNVNNFFGASGIYSNPTNEELEIPISAEYILPNGSTGFQIDAGLKIAGGASRSPGNSPKHSLSVRFRSEYGSSKLDYNLFNDTTVNSFNSIQLRAMYNNSWIHRDASQRTRATLIRDQFIRDSIIAMGQSDGGAGNYAHLYLNGIYWGVYNVHERADASHYAAYAGGSSDDYDALNGGAAIDGNLVSWNNTKSVVAGGNWNAIKQVLDVDNFIDWAIAQEYGGNVDLKTDGNWRAAGGGSANAKWKIYAWDSERVLEGNTAGAPGTLTDATGLYNNLKNVAEFRVRFGDRVQKHFFNGGAMTPSVVAARWNARVSQLNLAIVAESARWGDYRRDVAPQGSPQELYKRITHWLPEISRLNSSYFPSRSDFVVGRYRTLNQFPNLAAPAFRIDGSNQHGGLIPGGNSLSITGSGQIYFTLDGSDPRAEGGAAVGTLYSAPVVLSATTVVKARSLSAGVWSAVSQATFIVPDKAIVVSEINYHPYVPTAAELAAIPGVAKDDFEFIEIMNTHPTSSINLLGVKLASAVNYTFGNVFLPAGARGLIVENLAAFQLRYGTGLNVFGQWSGGLDNSGENVQLLDAINTEIMSVKYGDSDPWSVSTDGFGATLVMTDPVTTPKNELGKYYRWRGSLERGGSPGTAGLNPSGIVINEVLAHTDAPLSDSIELFNPTNGAVDIGGWYLSDSGDNPAKFQIPAGTMLGAGQYIVFTESDFNPSPGSPQPHHFALNAAQGDEVYLTRVTNGVVVGFEDAVAFGATFNGESLGRIANGSGRLNRLAERSFGAVNGRAKTGPLVITEVNYHPGPPNAAAIALLSTITTNQLEFVEIHNPTASAINTTNWRLRGEVDFNFPAESLGSRQTWILVSFDPNLPANASLLAAFKANYGITTATIKGPFTGALSNSFGRVALQQPDSPPANNPTITPRIVVDEVLYDDLAPWANADGNGDSLNRSVFRHGGNLATNWTAQTPTPGAVATVIPKLVSVVRDGGDIRRPDRWSSMVVVFDADINLTASALTMSNLTLSGATVNLTGMGFSYDIGTFTATWNFTTLAQPLAAAFYTYVLNSSSITSFNSGHQFDGDNNGTAGGNFSAMQYVAIPGDANLDGDVDISEFDPGTFTNVGDLFVTKGNLGTAIGATWKTGDYNGDGDVDVSQIDPATFTNVGDLAILYANLGRNVRPPSSSSIRFSGSLPDDVTVDSALLGIPQNSETDGPSAKNADLPVSITRHAVGRLLQPPKILTAPNELKRSPLGVFAAHDSAGKSRSLVETPLPYSNNDSGRESERSVSSLIVVRPQKTSRSLAGRNEFSGKWIGDSLVFDDRWNNQGTKKRTQPAQGTDRDLYFQIHDLNIEF